MVEHEGRCTLWWALHEVISWRLRCTCDDPVEMKPLHVIHSEGCPSQYIGSVLEGTHAVVEGVIINAIKASRCDEEALARGEVL